MVTEEAMQRLKSWTTVLLLLLLLLTAFAEHARGLPIDTVIPVCHDIDRVVFTHPGYTITVSTDGSVMVDLRLNQRGIPRKEIESSYASYPRERSRLTTVEPRRAAALLGIMRSPEFAAVGSEYLAPQGTFAYAGHRVIMTIGAYACSSLARHVTFDSSRKPNWPTPLQRAFDEVIRLGQATGPFPVGPFID